MMAARKPSGLPSSPWNNCGEALAGAFATGRLAIAREEQHLALRFGAAWSAYAARTPRWLLLR